MPTTTADPTLALKHALLAECRRQQQRKADDARRAMEEVQESANESQGAIEDKFESFREACQIQRDLFARQLEEALSGLQVLDRVPVSPTPVTHPALGSVVFTNRQTFYVALSLGELQLDGQKYFALSAQSPLFQAMSGHGVGETFSFRGVNYTIKEIQ